MGKCCSVWTQCILGAILPWILHTISLFSNWWVIEDGRKIGLFYQTAEDGSSSMSIPDQASLGLQCTSFCLLTLSTISCVTSIKIFGPDKDDYIDNDDDDTCITCCCGAFYCSIFLYICTSFLIFGGCVRFGSFYPLEKMGVSFYLALSSFLIMWLAILIFFIDLLCKKKKEDKVYETLLEKIYSDAL
ncbi:uncharacterized protein LOC128217102 isoform X2 [Mya arenaria]|uniref:uncharacterized protein LOC128217102 isoform X2 n=1 Tax=Mya arenaria TaxID=6604 RepID=UPI0022E43EFB|nr:uncharacterized protein LOC128217102 isoform X2 [Mya arenaria]